MLHITKHGGKLTGIPSINISDPEFCIRSRKICGSVCSKCYSKNSQSFRPSIGKAIAKNDFLADRPIEKWEIPLFNPGNLVRFNSFGELHNVQHLANIYAICKANPKVKFALWTKRKDIVESIDKKQPGNLVLVYSVMMIDTPIDKIDIPDWADYVYSVYTSGDSCGKNCLACQKCYRKPKVKGAIIRQRLHA